MLLAKVAGKIDCVTHHCTILPAFGGWAGANVKPCALVYLIPQTVKTPRKLNNEMYSALTRS